MIGGLDEQNERESAECAPCYEVPASTVIPRSPCSPDQGQGYQKFIERHRNEPPTPPKAGDLASRDDERDQVRESIQCSHGADPSRRSEPQARTAVGPVRFFDGTSLCPDDASSAVRLTSLG